METANGRSQDRRRDPRIKKAKGELVLTLFDKAVKNIKYKVMGDLYT